jgi:hypothetical protein
VTDSGIIATIASTTIGNGVSKPSGGYQYILKKDGTIFIRFSVKKKNWSKWEMCCKEKPMNNDTIFTINDTLTYSNIKLAITNNEVFCLQSINCGLKTTTGQRFFYAAAIGLIGSDFCSATLSRNLIEYRIGNGPVIKKHWLMEKPEKK